MYQVLIERPRGGAGRGRDWPRFDWRKASDYAARLQAAIADDCDERDNRDDRDERDERDERDHGMSSRHWEDGGPTKLRMGPRQRSKWLSENLAPLRRFLQRRIGRPWNQVHREICAHLKLDSTVQKHVLDHLWHYVERNPVFIDNGPHHGEARRYGIREGHGYSPLSDYGQSFYVCPMTGTLKCVRRMPRRVRSDIACPPPQGSPS